MDGTLTTLLSSGMDAFTNLWDVLITFPTNIQSNLKLGNATNAGAYSVRAIGFQPPELSAMTYQVDYKAISLTRPQAKFEGERSFTLEFRLDADYNLLYDLLSWKHIFFDPSGEANMQFGGLSKSNVTTDKANYGQIQVFGYDSSIDLSSFSDASGANKQISWTFMDVACMKVGTPNYQRASTDAVTVTTNFIFGRHYEPGSSASVDQNVTPTLNYK